MLWSSIFIHSDEAACGSPRIIKPRCGGCSKFSSQSRNSLQSAGAEMLCSKSMSLGGIGNSDHFRGRQSFKLCKSPQSMEFSGRHEATSIWIQSPYRSRRETTGPCHRSFSFPAQTLPESREDNFFCPIPPEIDIEHGNHGSGAYLNAPQAR